MSSPWDSQVDAMADTIEQMVRSGKGEVSDFRNTANDTIAKVGSALPQNVRQGLHNRLNSRLDMLENEINAKIDQAATIVAEESKEALDGAMMQFIQTMKGLPVDELTQLFSFIDKDKDGTINQEEFGDFVATTLPPGTVIPPAAIALGFQVLDTDRTGSLSISDILGSQGEVITTAARIVSEEIKEQPIELQEEIIQEEIIQEEIIQEEIIQEEIVEENTTTENENLQILDSMSISSKLSEARFSSEKTRIIEAMKGNPVEFDVSINRIRSEGTSDKPMEVEVSASDGSNYIISIEPSKISTLQSSLEKKSGTVRINGSVLGFNMARNCVTIDISQIE
jgi:Ca2+-binding EF-hand superfamily protein